jgi:uncharacterized repeat protein (TIGR01451 family)
VNEAGKTYHWAAFTNRADATADLAVSLGLDAGTAELGAPAILTATLANAGPAGATNAALEVDVPAGLILVDLAAEAGFVADESTPQLLRLVYDLPAGAQRQVTATFEVASGARLRTFQGRAAGDQVDPVPADNEDGVTLTVPTAALALALGTSDATPVAGDPIQLSVSLANLGPEEALATRVDLTVPAGLTVGDAIPSAGSYDPGSGVWTLGTVAAAASPVLLLDAVVGADQNGAALVVEGAATSARNDPDLADNQAMVAMAVGGNIDANHAIEIHHSFDHAGYYDYIQSALNNNETEPD